MKSRHSHAGLGHAPSRKHAHDSRTATTRGRPLRPAPALRALGRSSITVGMAAVEAVGGCLSGSLALLSDAGHMATDAAALGLALFADCDRAPAAVAPRDRYGYGARRSAGGLRQRAGDCSRWSCSSPSKRCAGCSCPRRSPAARCSTIAIAGLIANLVAGMDPVARRRIARYARGALLHVLSDVLGSVAAIVAGGGHPRDRLDAHRSDPVDRRGAADPALDVATA